MIAICDQTVAALGKAVAALGKAVDRVAARLQVKGRMGGRWGLGVVIR
jgi:hypothetical protein